MAGSVFLSSLQEQDFLTTFQERIYPTLEHLTSAPQCIPLVAANLLPILRYLRKHAAGSQSSLASFCVSKPILIGKLVSLAVVLFQQTREQNDLTGGECACNDPNPLSVPSSSLRSCSTPGPGPVALLRTILQTLANLAAQPTTSHYIFTDIAPHLPGFLSQSSDPSILSVTAALLYQCLCKDLGDLESSLAESEAADSSTPPRSEKSTKDKESRAHGGTTSSLVEVNRDLPIYIALLDAMDKLCQDPTQHAVDTDWFFLILELVILRGHFVNLFHSLGAASPGEAERRKVVLLRVCEGLLWMEGQIDLPESLVLFVIERARLLSFLVRA